METWSHLCSSANSFFTLPLSKACDTCGLSHEVQSLRYEGYDPKPILPLRKKTEPVPFRTKVAALLLPKATSKIIDESQTDYYDRHG